MKAFSRALPVLAIAILCGHIVAESPETAHFTSAGRQVSYEIFGARSSGPIIIMLHGAGGPNTPLYRELAQNFATKNYTVLFLHYFDATDTQRASDQNYLAWEQAVGDLVQLCKKSPTWGPRKIAIFGFSLGASVALASGSFRAR